MDCLLRRWFAQLPVATAESKLWIVQLMALPGAAQKKACKKRFSIRRSSFFEKSHLQLWQLLGLTYLWCRSAGKSREVSVEDAQHELQIGNEHSIVDWNQYCRDIAVSHFLNNPVQIGVGMPLH